MNPISKVNYPQKEMSFKEMYNHEVSKNIIINSSAAATALMLYHPWRTVSTQIVDRFVSEQIKPINFSPRVLYKGFMYGALGAHQIFMIGFFGQLLKKNYLQRNKEASFVENIAMGAIAGLLTTSTITPTEVMMIRKQQGQSAQYPLSTLYRGIIPQAMRQTGLGVGMLALPAIFTKKTKELAPDFYEKHSMALKIANGIVAGILTAAATQVPEIARQLLQSDPFAKKYPSNASAFKEALKIVPGKTGRILFGIRVGVMAISTVAMTVGRDVYSKYFF